MSLTASSAAKPAASPYPQVVDPQVFARRRAFALLMLYALLVFLPGMFTLPLTDRDEAGYIEATREMLLANRFILMEVAGAPLNDPKPVGIHWLQAPLVWAFQLADSNEAVWVYRLVSLFGALGSVALTFALGRRLFDAQVAWVGAFAYASSLCLMIESTIAKTDAALQFSLVAAMLAALYLASGMLDRSPAERRRFAQAAQTRRNAALFWIMLAVGVLIKGPVILVVCGLFVLSVSLLWREIGWWRAYQLHWGIPLFLLLAVPWFVAASLASDGAYLRDSLMTDALPKLFGSRHGHAAPFGTQLLLSQLWLWPGLLLAYPALHGAWQQRREQPVRLLLCWLLPVWLFFEISVNKLPHYVMPTYPALMLLGAYALQQAELRWARRIAALLVLLVALLLAALIAVSHFAYASERQSLGLLLAVLVLLPAFALALAFWRQRNWLPLLGITAILFSLSFMELTLPRLDRLHSSENMVRALSDADIDPSRPVIVSQYGEQSLVFRLGPERFRKGGSVEAIVAQLTLEPATVALVLEEDWPALREIAEQRGWPLALLGQFETYSYNLSGERLLTYRLVARKSEP